ncbi:dicarboxylate/amino acid:cation symporter [Thermomonas hydrothermalis]|uniref:Dicarboxylate/amino acid:cation (Na+ or H+) symporter, DAACS family n=1 Tax=Thermomonas hydrothermalis TaxID=213588 RepID=A0A1M4WG03_9GAMM|nr:dicarboxylate/amino acid:cation symporter [Thermomonas hydrothermalis]SHE80117.1 dicarboxylate/amino acid:cation (Na+ or H+) symporter, DAACS family [Thermomonas hydrothermalis]
MHTTETAAAAPAKGMPLHLKVGIGFLLGTLLGIAVHLVAPDAEWVRMVIDYAARPFGTIFLNLLFMMVVPLIFSALVLGVAELGDVASLGRLGWRTLTYTAVVTGIAVLIGLVMANLLQPGVHMDPAMVEQALSSNADKTTTIVEKGRELRLVDIIVNIVPHNIVGAMGDDSKKLGIVFFALMFGVGLVMRPTPGTQAFKNTLHGLFEVCMHLIGMFVKLAPYAVACFMFILCAQMGWEVLVGLGWFVLTVVLALAIHGFVVLPLWVKFMGGMSVRAFFRGVQEASLTAFATASSAATLPVTLRVGEENLKLPRKISRFVLTVGASASHHGSALFEGITVLFLAQVYGMHLPLGEQVLVLILCILGGIGTASIPSGSLPVIAMICGIVGLKPEGIGIILGVNTFLDMCRTSLNVTGDLAMAVVVAKQSGQQDLDDAVAEKLDDIVR